MLDVASLFLHKATNCAQSCAEQLLTRVLLPQDQLGALMSILKEHMRHMEREQLSFHQSELTGFFLAALDFRAQFCQVRLVLSRRTVCPRDLLNVLLGAGRPGDGSSDRGQRHRLPAGHGDETVRSHVQAVLLQGDASLLLTLFDLGRTCNSGEMKSRIAFFPQLFDWSKSGRKERLLTFFRLSDCIAERLKGLFVLFAGNLVKPFADLLQQTNVSKTGEACIFFNPHPLPQQLVNSSVSVSFVQRSRCSIPSTVPKRASCSFAACWTACTKSSCTTRSASSARSVPKPSWCPSLTR